MKRKTCFAIVLIASLLFSASALAAQKLPKYSLVVSHELVELSSATGYVCKSGKTLMVPIKTVCEKLGLYYEESAGGKLFTVTRADDVKVVLRVGAAYANVGGSKYQLRTKTISQSGGRVTCDVKAVKYMLAGFKHYYASLAKPAGYPSGAIVISSDGDLSLPSVEPVTDGLPEALRPASRLTNQIVGVEYKSGSAAKLTLYEKVNNAWLEQYSCQAVLGKNGIGKTKEGDGKTPTGTFNLTQPFGILANPGCKMSGYTKVTKYHYWCSNSQSKYYNRLIDIRNVDYTPTDADEKLISIAPYYNYALFIDYNADCVPGVGSAIFLHCKGSKNSTSGCVAIPQAVMKSLLMTLDRGAKIVIY